MISATSAFLRAESAVNLPPVSCMRKEILARHRKLKKVHSQHLRSPFLPALPPDSTDSGVPDCDCGKSLKRMGRRYDARIRPALIRAPAYNAAMRVAQPAGVSHGIPKPKQEILESLPLTTTFQSHGLIPVWEGFLLQKERHPLPPEIFGING